LWTVTNLLFEYLVKIKIKLTLRILHSLLVLKMLCICRFKHLCIGNHSELDTCSFETFFSQWPILSQHKILTFPSESSCIQRVMCWLNRKYAWYLRLSQRWVLQS
jgi:hypothetical protein